MEMNCKVMFSFRLMTFIFFFSICTSGYSLAQSVISDVRLEATRLTPKEQNDLQALAREISAYINEFEYTEDSYDLKFRLDMQIFVESVTIAGSEKLYHSKVAITNRGDQRYFDKRWVFVYTLNDPLFHSGVFHTITSFVDFYVNLILGGEFDNIEPLQGSNYYNNAKEIASRGKISSHPQGWRNREIRIDDISSNWRLRDAKGKYSDFLYFLYEEEEPAEALKSLNETLDLFRDIFELNSLDKYPIEFLSAHVEELSKAVYGYRKRELFERLIFINPTNTKTYQIYLDKLDKE